jgi:hypothetical protein
MKFSLSELNKKSPLEDDVDKNEKCFFPKNREKLLKQYSDIYQDGVIEHDPFTGALEPTSGQIEHAKNSVEDAERNFYFWKEDLKKEGSYRNFFRRVLDNLIK